MPIQLSNISSISEGTFKFTELSGSEKPLPSINSLIKINIIEKFKDGYKVLIEGRVFLSKLPINADINESIIAKVLNHTPFTLALNNIITNKGIDESISMLLSKLNIPSSLEKERILKLFLLCRKPIVKSKLERLSELLKSNIIDLDDDQLTEAILFLESSDTNYQNITPSLLNLFKIKNSVLAYNILNLLRELNRLLPLSEFSKKINSLLIIKNNVIEKLNPLLIRDYAVKLGKVSDLITESQEYISDEKTLSIIHHLTNSLLIYKIRQALSLNRGNIYLFLIIETDGELELLEFESDLHNQDFNFNLNMMPENLGLINARGVYTSNSLSLDVFSNNETRTLLEKNKDELEKELESSIHCRQKLTFSSTDNWSNVPPVKRGNLNVTI